MLELVAVLPLLVVIVIGVADYGRIMATSVAVANAARAGAEWGIQQQFNYTNHAQIRSFAQLDGNEAGSIELNSRTIFMCGPDVVTSSTICGGGYGAPRVYVEVSATKTVPLIMRFPGIPSSITVSRTATFRYQ
jgi:Flp pilus assembly protein TadG